jgi:hypothetical protein
LVVKVQRASMSPYDRKSRVTSDNLYRRDMATASWKSRWLAHAPRVIKQAADVLRCSFSFKKRRKKTNTNIIGVKIILSALWVASMFVWQQGGCAAII